MPPPERSLRRLAETIVGEASASGRRRSVSAALRQPERYSSTYGWYERVRAGDRHCDAVRRREHERAIEEMAVRHAAAASRLLETALSKLDDLDPEELRPADLARYLDVGVRIERLSRGADAVPSGGPPVEENARRTGSQRC